MHATREGIRAELEAAGRNRAVVDAAQWLAWGHLSGPARQASVAAASLADWALAYLPDTPELTHALRRLIEAKDCLVRAAIESAPATAGRDPEAA